MFPLDLSPLRDRNSETFSVGFFASELRLLLQMQLVKRELRNNNYKNWSR
jgi:hypothetical protein